ncbi:Aromatic-L-amino-acid decarboxylase [Capsicum chinense]|nr:Aromatic-L-amino-acid decarboxylase [Capsicum chinense]
MGSLDSNSSTQTHSSVTEFNPLDPEEFRTQAHQMVDFIADYYKNIESYPVLSQVEPGYLRSHLPENAPYFPESLDTIMKDVQNHIVPGMTHWLSPNFFAFFPATFSGNIRDVVLGYDTIQEWVTQISNSYTNNINLRRRPEDNNEDFILIIIGH